MIHKLKQKFHIHKLQRAQKREEKKQRIDQLRKVPTIYDNAPIFWQSPEVPHHERGPIWKIFSITAVAALVGGAIFYQSWTFAVAVLTFAATYAIVHRNKPKILDIKISSVGIKIGHHKYPYNRIKAFWIIYEPPFVQTLNLRISGEILSEITLQLNGQNPAVIREYLLSKIPELEGQSEKISDIFLRIFRI
ncbi:MAG: hypothetical protein AAB373_02975 [Patescibacteria group bacterium]